MGKLLIIADEGEKCSATPRGLALAHRLGLAAEVIGFTHADFSAADFAGNTDKSALKQQLLARREQQILSRVQKYAAGQQSVKTRVVWSREIHDWVNKRAARGYDAVVKTVHRSGSLLYTSTDWHLIRECPAPVLIVAERRWSRTRPVLATIDVDSPGRAQRELNDRVLETAVWLSQTLDAELRIISALYPSPVLTELDLVDADTHFKKLRERARIETTRLARVHGLPKALFRSKRGPVAKVIVSDAALQQAQLVVMGTVGRRGLRARLLGNTAESVLQQLQTDVFTLKP